MAAGDNSLLYRHECFTGKYATRKIHTRLHPGREWRIVHILTSEDSDMELLSLKATKTNKQCSNPANQIKSLRCSNQLKTLQCSNLWILPFTSNLH